VGGEDLSEARSNNSDSLTPEIPVDLGSLSLGRERRLDVTYPPELPSSRLSAPELPSRLSAAPSHLSDLPPLGPMPVSVRGRFVLHRVIL